MIHVVATVHVLLHPFTSLASTPHPYSRNIGKRNTHILEILKYIYFFNKTQYIVAVHIQGMPVINNNNY